MRVGVLLPALLLFSFPAQAETRNGLLHKAESALCGTTTLPPSGTTDVGFSPGNGALNVVLRVIGSAKREIPVATYSFTSKEIAQALVEAAKRGVDVRVVVDKSQLGERYTAATFLANQGVRCA
ncbi:MAG: phospholipase D-like domain-containing protein [Proteobacteria bacterium]|nr:phospholipase D-like domain-containing protein [Pseudomonadota bacterium]